MALTRALLGRNIKCYLPVITQGHIVQNSYLSTTPQDQKKKSRIASSALVTFAVAKYNRYVTWYEGILERRYPGVFKIYKIVKHGLRDLFLDARDYFRIYTQIRKGKPLGTLTRRELEVYRQLPHDLLHCLPLYCLQAIPFVGNVFFIVAYKYPKSLLSHQFWTPDQKMQFWLEDLTERVQNYNIIMAKLERKTRKITDDKLRIYMEDVLHELHSNRHPSTEQLLLTRQLFVERPFGIHKVGYKQMINLCKIHERWPYFQPRARMHKYGMLLRATDLAITRDGFADENAHEIIAACFIRGLNPKSLHTEQRIAWLKQWVEVAEHVDEDCISLLLHCPIFLGLNEPTNKVLYR
ncbi:PREDICTED: LETM1 domain-containing protein 1-like isoform X1 [Priapulus caudatus]|uniref:LETM1 domain-containing protein 1-like isoform X1 n=1 Tax=Priapulus caudatus TaxID=37621 RepID=A0ABM1FBU8_PRICU|nr:PREDICTED: LETM1 domain-containing protein 1-like isoform X1 [Priapulus caudatus]